MYGEAFLSDAVAMPNRVTLPHVYAGMVKFSARCLSVMRLYSANLKVRWLATWSADRARFDLLVSLVLEVAGGVVTLEGDKNGSSGDVASEEGALDDGDRASRDVARTSASRAE